MEPEQVTEINTPIKKTADKTAYMREYKRKQYKENPNIIKGKNKAYYYKYKFGIEDQEMKKYDIFLPLVLKVRKAMKELKEQNENLYLELLGEFVTEDVTITEIQNP
jgi:hypothetical protein